MLAPYFRKKPFTSSVIPTSLITQNDNPPMIQFLTLAKSEERVVRLLLSVVNIASWSVIFPSALVNRCSWPIIRLSSWSTLSTSSQCLKFVCQDAAFVGLVHISCRYIPRQNRRQRNSSPRFSHQTSSRLLCLLNRRFEKLLRHHR